MWIANVCFCLCLVVCTVLNPFTIFAIPTHATPRFAERFSIPLLGGGVATDKLFVLIYCDTQCPGSRGNAYTRTCHKVWCFQ